MGVRDEGPNPAGKQALGRTILCSGGERKNLVSMPMATSVTSRWGPEPVHWVPWRQNGASAAFGMGSALRYASGGGSDLDLLQLRNFALVVRALGYPYPEHHPCPHPNIVQGVCAVCKRGGGGVRVGVGCTRYTAALHRHDLCLPAGQRQSGTPVKFFQLQLAKFSFGQLSAWAGLAPAGQGSLGDADPSSGPTGSASSMKSKLTASSCCGPASYPYF